MYQKLIQDLDRIFSLYIRLRDTDNEGKGRCISCSRMTTLSAGQCGHFVPRTYLATRYEETNNHLQCKYCNEYLDGNLEKYSQSLVNRYGPGVILFLNGKKLEQAKHSRQEIEDMITHYKQCVKLMKQIKKRGGSMPPQLFQPPKPEASSR